MKKYLMLAAAAAVVFASCSKMDGVATTQQEIDKAKYDYAFKSYIGGEVASEQTWGFSSNAYTKSAFTRSMSSPEVEEASAPYSAAWVASYLETATEPNSTNAWDNYDNSWSGYEDDYTSWNDETGTWNQKWVERPDNDYVTNFKITGTWDGDINVVATEDADGDPRTVVVTGTWNLTADQRVGGKGRIIVANGGTINISSGKKLNSVNEAQIVVLAGGQIIGEGSIEYSNGTDSDLLSGNWGTINVGKFNNNGGNFYNYGTLNTDVMDGGAANSCYYNHGKVNVGNSGSSANIRIYNGCQWNVTGDFRLKMLENTSYFYVGGRLETIGSEDGTGQDAYVALGDNSLLEAGSLHNTGAIWYGPTGSLESTYAVADFGYIYQLDWAPGSVEDGPLASGYFANNIYVNIHNQDNAILGSAGSQTAKQVFWSVVANGQGQGNGNVTEITDGDTEIIYGDSNFSRGTSGCKPSYTANIPTPPTPPAPDADLRIICEDLSATSASDFDFNDIVIDVTYGSPAVLTLQAAGGTLPLRINGDNNLEVHKLFGVWEGDEDIEANTQKQKMVNTGAGPSCSAVVIDSSKGFNMSINSAEDAKNLKIEVYKNGSWQELTAEKGEPACKLAVDPTFTWMSERKSIKDEYELFVTWATDNSFKSKWW
ncbi:MAG: hypothetical protein II404_08675 [Prevotella sp.]|nr:hypothetical protein [Prevotella sp.]